MPAVLTGQCGVAPGPMTVVLGLGMRLWVRMHTRLENGVLQNEQQSGSAVNSLSTSYEEAEWW